MKIAQKDIVRHPELSRRGLSAINMGRIPHEQTAINCLAQWANDCERALSGLSVGYVLDRSRHKAWATKSDLQSPPLGGFGPLEVEFVNFTPVG